MNDERALEEFECVKAAFPEQITAVFASRHRRDLTVIDGIENEAYSFEYERGANDREFDAEVQAAVLDSGHVVTFMEHDEIDNHWNVVIHAR